CVRQNLDSSSYDYW
nr:immunoglobulin heavy chain junction region [Macaca mulatta]